MHGHIKNRIQYKSYDVFCMWGIVDNMKPEKIADLRILQILEDAKSMLNDLKRIKMKISISMPRKVYSLTAVRSR